MAEDIHNWQPMSVNKVLDLFSGLDVPWWIAGGMAIELFVGHETRAHGDTDVLIKRDDQLKVQEYLADWDLHKTQQPGLKPWLLGEFQKRPFDDIWCRKTSSSPWVLQLMLLDTDGEQWIFKRDSSIGGALKDLGRSTDESIPYVSPHIQLLHKAKTNTLKNDQIDFEITVPLLEKSECQWLLDCLTKRFPKGHDWTDRLQAILKAN